MKKSNLYLVFLMALIVMSCSKDETTMSIPQESNAIEFGTYVGRGAQTRATVIDVNNLPTLGFGVFAYYTDGAGYSDNSSSGSTPNFMYNTKVSGENWIYSPIKYWPNETTDKLTFFAYAPYSDGTQNNISSFSGNTVTGDPTLKFTVNGVVKEQTDLLYADPTNLKDLGKQSIVGKVLFPFKHALSRIGFKVEVMADKVNDDATGTNDDGSIVSDDIASGTVVSVQKVELIGKFVNSNTFNFAKNTWATPTDMTADDYAYSLNYNETEASSDFVNTVANTVTTTATKLNADDSYLMIIPKTFATGDLLKIRVTYTVTTTDSNLASSSVITNVITSEQFAFSFVAGKAYTFNLHLGMTSVKFDATVTGWDGVTPETVVNVPINTN